MSATTVPAATTTVNVDHLEGDRFAIDIRGHRISVDQPVDAGGEDTAPTPTELLVASLASCVAFYARRYLARHGLDSEGLAVRAAYAIGGRPNRVLSMDLELDLPPGIPESRREPLLVVASHCTVHNTLADPPAVSIRLA